MRTCATMCSGGGGAEIGLMLAGYTPVWAIEVDPAIADVYRLNIGGHCIVARVQDVDYRTLLRPDLLHVSPSCKEASQAKTKRRPAVVQPVEVRPAVFGVLNEPEPSYRETPDDLEVAEAICRALDALTPDRFTLENVWGYRTFTGFRRICATLTSLGYIWDYNHLNSADYGVPQTRKRLILRATRLGLLPHFDPPVRWKGWYEAIEDLIPELPTSTFAKWQLARLPEQVLETLLVGSGNTQLAQIDSKPRRASEPMFTVPAHEGATRTRAFIVEGTPGLNGTHINVRGADSPDGTISASMDRKPARAYLVNSKDQAQQWDKLYRCAWLAQGRVVQMTPRALARFQSVPDSYILPEKRSLACVIIGNMVPPLLAYAFARDL